MQLNNHIFTKEAEHSLFNCAVKFNDCAKWRPFYSWQNELVKLTGKERFNDGIEVYKNNHQWAYKCLRDLSKRAAWEGKWSRMIIYENIISKGQRILFSITPDGRFQENAVPQFAMMEDEMILTGFLWNNPITMKKDLEIVDEEKVLTHLAKHRVFWFERKRAKEKQAV